MKRSRHISSVGIGRDYRDNGQKDKREGGKDILHHLIYLGP